MPFGTSLWDSFGLFPTSVKVVFIQVDTAGRLNQFFEAWSPPTLGGGREGGQGGEGPEASASGG